MDGKNETALTVRATVGQPITSQDDVAQEIARLHNEVLSCAKIGIDRAVRIGELLMQQKAKLGHGYFTSWISVHLPFTDRTARNYMRLYENREQLKTENVSVLTKGYKLLTSPNEKAKLERPWEAYFTAKGSLLVLLQAFLDDPLSIRSNMLELAKEHSQMCLRAMDSYLANVEATSDQSFMISEYVWADKALLELQNQWAEYRLRCERKLAEAIAELKMSLPSELYDFLEANHFSDDALQYLRDALREAVKA